VLAGTPDRNVSQHRSRMFRICSNLAIFAAPGQRGFGYMGSDAGNASQIIRQKGGGALVAQTSGLVWVVRQ
jgi:hypothetical protein